MKVPRIRKKIYLNLEKTKFCICNVFERKKDMQDFYSAVTEQKEVERVCGASLHYCREDFSSGKGVLSGETGVVLLNFQNCDAGVVAHEMAHAVLWAHKHSKKKKQHPLIIKDIEEEEVILYNLTFAIDQFYKWYFSKIVKKFNKSLQE